MKKYLCTFAIALAGITSAFALSSANIRENARFLSDRMAYELDLTPQQYDDCYEINYDFIVGVNPFMDDVVYGYQDAIDRYYDYLDYRNEDLRMVLTAGQYATFLTLDYFCRPIYTFNNNWRFRIFQVYTNHAFFYFDAPSIYHTYVGGHGRHHFANGFYGNGRYHHQIAPNHARFRGAPNEHNVGRMDFGNARRERGAAKHQMNNYNNRDSRGREQDRRYQNDRPGNQNSPLINNRNSQPQGNRQGNAQQGGQPQGNRQGNAQQSAPSRGSSNAQQSAPSRGSSNAQQGGSQPQSGHGHQRKGR